MSKTPPDRASAVEKARHTFLLRMELITQGFSFGRYFVGCIVVCVLGYFGYRSVEVMAGKSTDFKAIMNWAADWRVSEMVAWLAAVLLGSGYYKQRNVLKRLRRDDLSRVADLEKRLDPERSSSGLTPEGESPSEGAT